MWVGFLYDYSDSDGLSDIAVIKASYISMLRISRNQILEGKEAFINLRSLF